MQPYTLLISLNTYKDGVEMAELIRVFDDTADIHLHEARTGNGWSMTVHTCIPQMDAKEMRKRIRETGARLRVQQPDGA